MEIKVDIENLRDSNLFLRALWAEFRRTCGKCGWHYFPSKDGPKKEIFFGFTDIDRPEGALAVSVIYSRKGSIRSIRFTLTNELPLNPLSDLGKLIREKVLAAKMRAASPILQTYQSTIEALRIPPHFYEGQSFRIRPTSRRRFSLSIAVAAFDKTDAETLLIPKMRRMLDVLSVETNSTFWPVQKETADQDDPMEHVAGLVEVLVDDPSWVDEYPIRDELFLISAEGKRILEIVAKEDTLVDQFAIFMRACDHFHTARKYQAQKMDTMVFDEFVPAEQAGEYVSHGRISNARLQAAGQVGAAHAEITGTLYMSALEVASKIGGSEPELCQKCSQPQYKISKRVTDLVTKYGGPRLGEIAKDYYNQRSKYLHEGIMLSDSSYAGISIPLLDPSSSSGCRFQMASPSSNLLEYTGFCLRRVLKDVVEPQT